jgi:hypothetical protein
MLLVHSCLTIASTPLLDEELHLSKNPLTQLTTDLAAAAAAAAAGLPHLLLCSCLHTGAPTKPLIGVCPHIAHCCCCCCRAATPDAAGAFLPDDCEHTFDDDELDLSKNPVGLLRTMYGKGQGRNSGTGTPGGNRCAVHSQP